MKLDIKEVRCIGGRDLNEDAIGYGENYLFVIDAATGLSKAHITKDKTDARWFSNALKAGICKAFDENDSRETSEIIYEIIEDLKKQYVNLAKERGLELPPDYPSAGIALFRIRNNKLEFYGLGDCSGIIKLKNGEMVHSRDEVLPALDEISIQAMVDHLKQDPSASLFDMKDKAMDVILANRMKRNQKDGYMILDLSNEGTNHNRELIYDLDDVESIYVMSDGFYQLVDTFHIYKDYQELVNQINATSIKAMIADLFDAQENDLYGDNFPRLKYRDDTSAGWAKITAD